MPNHKSCEKRVRQTVGRTERNRAARSAFRGSLKKAQSALDSGSVKTASGQVQRTLSMIGKAESRGLIHRNKAARYTSRLMKRLHALPPEEESGTEAEESSENGAEEESE